MTYRTYSTFSLAIGAFIAATFFTLRSVEAKSDSYPRLANYYLSGPISEDTARQLAKWDMVVLRFEAPVASPDAFRLLKRVNPDVTLLVYIDSIMMSAEEPNSEPGRTKYRATPREWLLKSADGTTMTYWPGNRIVNPTDFAPQIGGNRWNTFLPAFAVSTLNAHAAWDGIFFDDAQPSISWLNHGDIDINNDGKRDQAAYIDQQWVIGLTKLFEKARALAGSNTIIITNSGSIYKEHMNGRMFENHFVDRGSWREQVDEVNDALRSSGFSPRYVAVNAGTSNTGDWQQWQKFRYAFTSTLLTDAYFSYDYGDKLHMQTWWYDEYDADLGLSRGEAYELSHGVWRRDFQRGIALVNPTGQSVTVDLGGEYQRLNGTQDRNVNNGMKAASVTLPAYDGITLKMSMGAINRAPATEETAVWSKGTLTLYRNGIAQWSMLPYDNRWRGSVSMAAGDVDGDGSIDIVLAAGPGGGPHIRIVGRDGTLKGPGFFAFDKRRRTGAAVVLADINGDSIQEIIVSSGSGEQLDAKAFTYRGSHLDRFDAKGYYKRFFPVGRIAFISQ